MGAIRVLPAFVDLRNLVPAGLDYKPEQVGQTHSGSLYLFTQNRCPYLQRRRVLAVCRAIESNLSLTFGQMVAVMLSLSYAAADGWRPDHISDFMGALRHWYRRQTGMQMPYVWVMEMQSRGTPHYHIMLWMPAELRLPFPDQGIRTPWWPHGTSNLKRDIQHRGAYLAKYIAKGKDMGFPRGARTFGSSQHEWVRDSRRWASAPGYVRAMVPQDDRVSRTPRLHIPAGYRWQANPNIGTEWYVPEFDRMFDPIGGRVDQAGFWLAHKSGIYLLPIHRHRYHLYCGMGLRRFFKWLGSNLAWTMPSERTVSAMLCVDAHHLR